MERMRRTQFHVVYPKNDTFDESPVVFLFGWIGAQDKYLKVYSNIYEERGFPTVRLIVSPIVVLFKNNEMATFSHKLIELLEEPSFKGRPIIFHIFSNGGTFQYEIFMKILDETKRKLVKGVIIDSGPAKYSLHNSFSVCNTILGSVVTNKALLYVSTTVIIALLATGVTVKKILRDVFRIPVHITDPYNNLINQENISPQLFIYSKSDSLVPYRELEKFIDRRRAIGVDVTTKLYENTQHVRHFPANKLDYKKTVYKFLNKVLRKYKVVSIQHK